MEGLNGEILHKKELYREGLHKKGTTLFEKE